MIALRSGRFNLHRGGVAQMLITWAASLCSAADGFTLSIRLFTSDNEPGCADQVDDYTEADFNGYAAVEIPFAGPCTDLLEFGLDPDGIGQLILDQQAFTKAAGATTNTVTGCYLTITDADDAEWLLGTLVFDAPVPMVDDGDILKVNGFALLDCQMVPVP